MGFGGPIWPVHPSRDQIGGLPCHRSVGDLPEPPDAVFVGVNRHTTLEVVRDLSEQGAGGVVCFASGFSEAAGEDREGHALQRTLLAAAGDMPLIGPNCYGLINYLDGALLWPDQHGGRRQDRGVAIVTQSSNIALNMTMHRRALPIAYVVTVGNQAQIGLADMGAALLEDERVTALGLHIEGFGDLRAWEHLAGRAHALGKPVVVLKVGRSHQARTAMVSHTNSLAGEDAGAEALLDRLGMARLESVAGFLEALKLLHVAGPIPGRRIASISCSGGEAALMADLAEGMRLVYPPLTDAQCSDLRAALGPMVALANPLDYHTYIWGDRSRMEATFTAVMRGNVDLTLAVLDFPREDRCDASEWQPAVEALMAARDTTGGALAVVGTLPENLPESIAESLVARRVTPLCGMADALVAAEAAATCGEALSRPLPAPLILPGSAPGGVRLLAEDAAKAMLAAYGLVAPRSAVVETPEAAVSAAEAIGFPVALKARGIAHKTEAGAVRLDLTDADAVNRAAADMQAVATGYLVEEMIVDGVAELLIGVVRDPAHGFLLTLAAGGILTEVMRDSGSMLLPVTSEAVLSALKRLRLAPLLAGHRGRPGTDLGAIVAAVQGLCTFVAAHADRVEEAEINPLICRPRSAVMADALIHMRETPDD
jgi:acyl-CoA synthetase (NDP forming)